MKVLLLNPPGNKKYIRDQYCSFSSKTNYYWAPVDLLILSGILDQEHEVIVLDAIVEDLNFSMALKRILSLKPDVIITLSSLLTSQEDFHFILQCKKHFSFRSIFLGDVFYFRPDEMINHSAVDAICLEFPAFEILNYLRQEKDIPNMIYKSGNHIIKGKRVIHKNIQYPIPLHHQFKNHLYQIPLAKRHPFHLVLTNFGCVYRCSYCPAQTLQYFERDFSNIVEELDYLQQMEAKEIWFRDFTFTSNKKRVKKLCQIMIEKKYDFSWFCLARADNLDDELVNLMKESGCHLIMLGVETNNPQILDETQRKLHSTHTLKAFQLCQKYKIDTMAIMMMGFPHESEKSMRSTLNFILSLHSTYLSINIFAARPGSEYFQENYLQNKQEIMSGLNSAEIKKSYCQISPQRLKYLQKLFYLKFYLHPQRILRLLGRLSSFMEIKILVTNGLRLIFNKN